MKEEVQAYLNRSRQNRRKHFRKIDEMKNGSNNKLAAQKPLVPVRSGRISKLENLLTGDKTEYSMMLDHIRSGAFDWVAAQAMGIHSRSFCRWMSRGRKESSEALEKGEDIEEESLYCRFFLDVTQARAEARREIEIVVAKKNPELWLRCGPGRGEAEQPGWTDDRLVVEGQIEHGVEFPGRLQTSSENLAAGLQCLAESLPGGLQQLIDYSEKGKDQNTIESVFKEGEVILEPEEPMED